MNSNCPYCGGDTFNSKYIIINNNGYNKCLKCNEWSLHDVNTKEQKERPIDITNELLNETE